MKNFAWLILLFSLSCYCQTTEIQMHSAVYPSVGIVRVIQPKNGPYKNVVVDFANGFTIVNSDCDFLTTFDVVFAAEEWPALHRYITVTIGSNTYPALLRTHGVYPFGYNLACLDLPPDSKPKMYPLIMRKLSPEFTFRSTESWDSIQIGTPQLDDKGLVVGMLLDKNTMVNSIYIKKFLDEMVRNSPRNWPKLEERN